MKIPTKHFSKKVVASVELLKKLEEFSCRAYIVGGFVRDYLLNIQTEDIDICTNISPKHLKEYFTVLFAREETYFYVVEFCGFAFDISLFKEEHGIEKARVPEKVNLATSLQSDLARRDFTINTIALDKNLEIIDYANGLRHLQERKIVCVGSVHRILDDMTRVIRAVRFAVTLGFYLDKELLNFILLTDFKLYRFEDKMLQLELKKVIAKGSVGEFITQLKLLKLDFLYANVVALGTRIDINRIHTVAEYDCLCVLFQLHEGKHLKILTDLRNEKEYLRWLSLISVYQSSQNNELFLSVTSIYFRMSYQKVLQNFNALLVKKYSQIKYNFNSDEIDVKMRNDMRKSVLFAINDKRIKNEPAMIGEFVREELNEHRAAN